MPNFCIHFLEVGPKNCKSFRTHKAWTCLSVFHFEVAQRAHARCHSLLSVYHCQYSVFHFQIVIHAHTRHCSSWSVYHIQYSVFCSELVQHADEQCYSLPSNTGDLKTRTAGHTQPVSSCIQSSP